MIFEVVPIIHSMIDLYGKPRSTERFHEYISQLQGGSRGDLELPIGGFNPMAKEHVLEKLSALEALNAEAIMREALAELDLTRQKQDSGTIKVVLNLADDLKGGWTNRYTTDFDSKFKLNALVTRNFCTPYFWTSEEYSEELIHSRAIEYAIRTLYWLDHGKLRTLEDHLNQETFVSRNASQKPDKMGDALLLQAERFCAQHRMQDDYNVIFNFFYGDEACESLGYPTFGMKGITGFQYAAHLSRS